MARGDRGDPDTLDERIAALPDLDRSQLQDRWRRIYRRAPPKRASREVMVRAIAHQMQVETRGGLDRRARRRLEQIIAALRAGTRVVPAPPRIKPGTRLVREWNGETLDVLVLEEGFAFRGKLYRSLSAIAREVTGTQWNGQVFFGLKHRAERRAPESAVERKPPSPEAVAREPVDGKPVDG